MAANKKQREESIVERAPPQPIPPSMDLGFVPPPMDPLGMSMRPADPTQPVGGNGNGETPAFATWLIVAALFLVAIAGIAIWVRLM
jgi:hypothetical protein